MFKFQDFNIYKKTKAFNLDVRNLLSEKRLDYATSEQLRRAALSVVLNVAEGSGRFTNKDIRRFYIMSRSSIFECVAILDLLKDEGSIKKERYDALLKAATELSVLTYTIIKKLSD